MVRERNLGNLQVTKFKKGKEKNKLQRKKIMKIYLVLRRNRIMLRYHLLLLLRHQIWILWIHHRILWPSLHPGLSGHNLLLRYTARRLGHGRHPLMLRNRRPHLRPLLRLPRSYHHPRARTTAKIENYFSFVKN